MTSAKNEEETESQLSLVESIRRMLMKEDPSIAAKKECWTVDADEEAFRYAVGDSFAGTDTVPGEPTWAWALSHRKRQGQNREPTAGDDADANVLTKEENVAWARYAHSLALYDDLRATSVQLCCMEKNSGSNDDSDSYRPPPPPPPRVVVVL